jgi:two-component sensor histidine kinase
MNRAGLDMIDAESLDQVKGLCVYPLVTEEYRDAFKAMVEGVFEGENQTLEFSAVGLKGRPIWLYSHSVPLRNEKGDITSLLSATVDITERKLSEDKLIKSNQEKEVLLQEIHHRVKNNMAIISALLQLQARTINDENVNQLFRDSQSRINSMALVHEKLYQTKDFININFRGYVEELVRHLLNSYGKNDVDLGLAQSIDDINLNIDTMIPCGLILNELVTNSLKHAFENIERPEISISLNVINEQATLVYSDNGKGMPEHVDFDNSKTLGLQIINMLGRQLKGTAELERDGGTKVTIKFDLATKNNS